MKNVILIILFGVLLYPIQVKAQGSPNYDGGIKLKLNESGKKYIRFLMWAQVQASYSNFEGNSSNNFQLRRARLLMYSQLTDKFLILTHFGLNSLNPSQLNPTGKGDGAQLFFHGMWVQYQVHQNHTAGAGLHYFNGVSRANNQSTLNMMTMDNNRQSWATLGLSDQFARHLGIFAKGSFNKLKYQVALNWASANSLDTRNPTENLNTSIYNGRALLESPKADFTYAGYFEYMVFDKESNFLPYRVGTYLGTKKVLTLGTGFFAHPNAIVSASDTLGSLTSESAYILGADVFYESPLGSSNAAITAYGQYQFNEYGSNYRFSAYGSGHLFYTHIGYLLASEKNTRFQPYVSYAFNSYEATQSNLQSIGLGANAFLNGHHSKLTLEYKNTLNGTQAPVHTVTLQAMIYL